MPKLRFTMTLHLAMTLLAISALAPVPATSQDEQVGESGTASWYQVELIVFAQGSGAAPTGEDFSPVPSDWVYLGGVYPGEDSGVIMSPGFAMEVTGDDDISEEDTLTAEQTGAETDEAAPTEEQERRFFAVDESALSLKAYYDTLRRRDAYEPLLYLAWAQPGYDADAAPVLPVDVFGGAGPGLDGEVSMYRSRYLHLRLDLILQSDQTSAAASAAATPYILETELPRFEMAQKRRMRSNEIHYFDHPRIGALAVIRPLDEAPAVAAGINPES